MYATLHSVFRKLPPTWRAELKRLAGTEGHGHSTFDWLSARKDALGKKRLDRALTGVVDNLGTARVATLRDAVCVDFGAGYVPTDGVAMWVLGAREVHGIDYNKIAKSKEIARAVLSADFLAVEARLETLKLDTDWRDRLTKVKAWAENRPTPFPPGYNYIAPADVIAQPSLVPSFDVLLSTSVLEHIRPSLMTPLLDALKAREKLNAAQFHQVDLRDHRDFTNAPYGFFDESEAYDPESDADVRGNGMSLRDWEALLTSHPEWNIGIARYQPGRPHLMPASPVADSSHIVADTVLLCTGAETTVIKSGG